MPHNLWAARRLARPQEASITTAVYTLNRLLSKWESRRYKRYLYSQLWVQSASSLGSGALQSRALCPESFSRARRASYFVIIFYSVSISQTLAALSVHRLGWLSHFFRSNQVPQTIKDQSTETREFSVFGEQKRKRKTSVKKDFHSPRVYRGIKSKIKVGWKVNIYEAIVAQHKVNLPLFETKTERNTLVVY